MVFTPRLSKRKQTIKNQRVRQHVTQYIIIFWVGRVFVNWQRGTLNSDGAISWHGALTLHPSTFSDDTERDRYIYIIYIYIHIYISDTAIGPMFHPKLELTKGQHCIICLHLDKKHKHGRLLLENATALPKARKTITEWKSSNVIRNHPFGIWE